MPTAWRNEPYGELSILCHLVRHCPQYSGISTRQWKADLFKNAMFLNYNNLYFHAKKDFPLNISILSNLPWVCWRSQTKTFYIIYLQDSTGYHFLSYLILNSNQRRIEAAYRFFKLNTNSNEINRLFHGMLKSWNLTTCNSRGTEAFLKFQ